ncbi:RNA polymerase sigma factor [Granulicoccus phenolivorans]|uniref:RNA polymerase sigma factor n=1 Tax=Granulicoccus phenolivorans TaxID=266854 RepID=UPI00041CDA89|nr:DUF6596 domain-containing protein [Granulicoccus phenolivorans]
MSVDDVLARFYREEHSRLLAALVARFGDLDLAEESAQEAMAAALATWPSAGVPDHPLAWLITTARRKALDRVRRDAVLARRLAELALERQPDEPVPAPGPTDERLAMLMGCCHPAIAPADRIALMLRFVGGLTSAEVAQSLLLPLPTIQARITRAKRRIRVNRIPLRVPEDPAEQQRRLPLILTAISLVFTEGYDATGGTNTLRADLTEEAIRLARIVAAPTPPRAEPLGLLALLLLTDARRAARVDAEGVPIALEEQDRTRWDPDLISEGLALVERAAGLPDAGRLTALAAIAAVHSEAATFADTDWPQIVALYDLLLRHGPDPVAAMNRAIAVGRRDTPQAGLALLEAMADEPILARHHPYHVALALFRAECADPAGSRRAWIRARDLVDNQAQRRFIDRHLSPDG